MEIARYALDMFRKRVSSIQADRLHETISIRLQSPLERLLPPVSFSEPCVARNLHPNGSGGSRQTV